MLVLAFSFVVASLLSFRFSNFAVRFVYWLAAVWLGFFNFFFWASLLVWTVLVGAAADASPADAAIGAPTGCRDFLRYRGPHRHLRSLERAHHSRSPHRRRASRSAGVLAGPARGSDQRSAPRADQRRAILPPSGRQGPCSRAGHSVYSRRFIRRHKGQSRRVLAPSSACAAIRHLLLNGEPRRVYRPTHYIEAITRAGIRVLGNGSSRSMECRSPACFITTPPRHAHEGGARRHAISTAHGPRSCSTTRPRACPPWSRPASACSSRATRTAGSFSLHLTSPSKNGWSWIWSTSTSGPSASTSKSWQKPFPLSSRARAQRSELMSLAIPQFEILSKREQLRASLIGLAPMGGQGVVCYPRPRPHSRDPIS